MKDGTGRAIVRAELSKRGITSAILGSRGFGVFVELPDERRALNVLNRLKSRNPGMNRVMVEAPKATTESAFDFIGAVSFEDSGRVGKALEDVGIQSIIDCSAVCGIKVLISEKAEAFRVLKREGEIHNYWLEVTDPMTGETLKFGHRVR